MSLVAAGCNRFSKDVPLDQSTKQEVQAEELFEGHGVARSITPSREFVVIEHGQIPGFMDAMTMAFAVPDSAVLRGIAPGDSIDFTVSVKGFDVYVTKLTQRGRLSENTTSASSNPLGFAKRFELKTIDGKTFALDQHFGDVIVLNFWATWCGPCREEIPDFVALQEKLRERGLLIVGVSTDETADALELVTDFAAEFSMNYPVMIDDGVVASLYGGNYALPTTFVIGRDGAIRHRVIGSVAAAELEPILNELLDSTVL